MKLAHPFITTSARSGVRVPRVSRRPLQGMAGGLFVVVEEEANDLMNEEPLAGVTQGKREQLEH